MDEAGFSGACEAPAVAGSAEGAQDAPSGPLAAREGEVLPPEDRRAPSRGGRIKGFRHPERMRARIQTGVILTRMHKLLMGRLPGTPPQHLAQIAAAKLLLSKALPDLQSIEIKGDADAPLVILTRME